MLKRQKHPYTSNCTDTWTSTDYTDVVRDPNGKYHKRKGSHINYNLAVRRELTHFHFDNFFRQNIDALLEN